MRKKIIILNTLVSGVILILFGLTGFQYLNSTGLRTIDDNIRDFARREMQHPNDMFHWERVETFPRPEDRHIMDNLEFFVSSFSEDFNFKTSDWPDFLDVSNIENVPTPEESEHHPPFPRDRFPGLTNSFDRPPPPDHSINAHSALPESKPVTMTVDGIQYRIIAFASPQARFIAAYNLIDHRGRMKEISYVFLFSTPFALLLIALGSWFTADRAVHSINILSSTTRDITASGLNQRVPVHNTDKELHELSQVYNEMLDRLERSFNQAIRFSGDAAHELKTPVTILHGQLEQMLHDFPEGSHQQSQIADLLTQVARLNRIIRNLLMLARMDAGRLVLRKESVNLSQVIREQMEDIDVMDETLTLESDIPDNINVPADPGLIRNILSNLITNAVKYNKSHGIIRVRLMAQANQVQIEIANTGIGLNSQDQQAIFQRFYRAQNESDTLIEGSGLGLSIAREIALIHNGSLDLLSSDSQWTVFRLTLPIGDK